MPAAAAALPDCFVVMPFGIADTDQVWTEVYEPTITGCGLHPVRIDREDNGGLLLAQIIERLQTSFLVLADLTYARPNCYYELGYAMGLGRERSVILCCRDDHRSDSPRFDPAKNKVHFDVGGYGILWWDTATLRAFNEALREKMERRMDLLKREAARLPPALERLPGATAGKMRDLTTELDLKLKRLAEREEKVAATWKRRS
jgi:hypothetical protein